MTVDELRKALADIPGELRVALGSRDGYHYGSSVEVQPMRPHADWPSVDYFPELLDEDDPPDEPMLTIS